MVCHPRNVKTPKGWPGDQGLGLRGLFPSKVSGLKPSRCYQLLWGQSIRGSTSTLIGLSASRRWNWAPRLVEVRISWFEHLSYKKKLTNCELLNLIPLVSLDTNPMLEQVGLTIGPHNWERVLWCGCSCNELWGLLGSYCGTTHWYNLSFYWSWEVNHPCHISGQSNASKSLVWSDKETFRPLFILTTNNVRSNGYSCPINLIFCIDDVDINT